MKILIVEDQLSIQEELRFFLEEYGTIDTADNGKLGVEAFQTALDNQSPYDLVLLDIQMPEMDGQEALKAMRQLECEDGLYDVRLDGSTASVIFMVSFLDTEVHVVKAFFHGGCTDYLTKPVTKQALLEKMAQYLPLGR